MATQVQQAIAWAKKRLGSSAYAGRCQAFVADAYAKGAGMPRKSASTAKAARKLWRVSTSRKDIPVGAAVYFDSPTAPSAGHVALCIGNDQVIHAFSSIKITSVASVIGAGYAYQGWGWNGGVKPSGAVQVVSTTTASSSNSSASSGSTGSTGSTEKESEEITTVVSKSVTGIGSGQKMALTGFPANLSYGIEILIQNDKVYMPTVESGIKLERSRSGSPSKLTFTVLKDNVLNFHEGNPVTMRFNGAPVFAGFVFQKRRTNYTEIEVVCYDQIRYLKNKSTFSYTNKTYGELLAMLAKDFHLTCGSVADTKYKIPTRIEEGTLLDALQNASDLTIINTGILYVLYDDFGKLTLKPLKDMILNLLVDEETASSFDYTSSIDKDVYNKIMLAVDNDETGQRETYVLNSPGSQAKWGQLQYYEKLNAETTPQILSERAKILLNYYNKKSRTLKISGVSGDVRVRGGSLIVVKMGLGDIDVQNYMCVEKVTHTFENGLHTMELSLSGIKGEFVAS
jgi:hypothetical protein